MFFEKILFHFFCILVFTNTYENNDFCTNLASEILSVITIYESKQKFFFSNVSYLFPITSSLYDPIQTLSK